MNDINQKIRSKSLQRIAKIFNVDADSLNDEVDLTTTFEPVSINFWARNQFDMVLDDIRDAADKDSIGLLNSGKIEIKTVGDYVKFMTMCYQKNPKLVQLVLGNF